MEGLDSYSVETAGKLGFHLGRKCITTLGDVLTLEELTEKAITNNQTFEEIAYNIMLELAPKAYK